MAAFIIPTIFTAINRFSGPASQVAASMQGVASSAGRAQVAFSTFSPLIDNTTTKLLSFARSAVLIGGILGGISFSAKSIVDYDKALAKFRIVVDDLNDADFGKYKAAIGDVAKSTMASKEQIANAFEAIAQISPEFAKTPEMISAVAKSAIVLSRAAGIEQKAAAEDLTTIMNQNAIGAEQADRVINTLAASAAIGAASINQLAEAYKNFGAVGVGANITLERSNAIFQVLAKNGITEAEAGTKARRVVLELQKAGVGYRSGKFDMVEALTTVKSRYDSLGSAMAKDAYLLRLFGEQGILVGQVLANNVPLLQQYEAAVTGTQEAHKQAAIMQETMAFKLEALGNAFKNTILDSKAAAFATMAFGGIVGFLTNHIEGLFTIATVILAPLLVFKAALITISVAARVATLSTGALSFAQGFLAATSGASALAMRNNAAAMRGYSAAATLARNSTLLFNVAMVAGVIALASFVSYVGDAEYAAYNASKGVVKMSEEYEKLGKSVTAAELKLKSLKDLQNRKKESENLQEFMDYELQKGTLYGYLGAAKAAYQLGSPFSDLNPANIDIESKNIGLQEAVYNQSAGKVLEDSLIKSITDMRQAAVDSANNRTPIGDIRASANVSAPIIYNTVNVDSMGNATITTNTLAPKATEPTSKWFNPLR